MASWEVHLAIHSWAAASAATAGALPVGADAVCLAAEEAAMVVHIASLFGKSISRKLAKQALTTGAFGIAVGSAAATALFEGLNLTYPATIPAKISVAVSVLEFLGWTTYKAFLNDPDFLSKLPDP